MTRRELDVAQCGTPGCTATHGDLWLHARCHRNVGTRVRYEMSTGELELTCRSCKALVARILVAPGGGDAAN